MTWLVIWLVARKFQVFLQPSFQQDPQDYAFKFFHSSWDLRPKGKWRKLAWQGAWLENTRYIWEQTGNYMWRCTMKMKLRFKASHEHADRERRCTSDLKHALSTTPMMLRMQMLPILLLVVTPPPRLRAYWATAKLLVNQPRREWGECTMKFHAIGDSSPTNTLLKQEGLQLAEASCCDLCSMFVGLMSNWCFGLIVAFQTASLQISVM